MRTLPLLALAALPLASLAGCGAFATMQNGGFTVNQGMTLEAFEAVKGRASFELDCPKDKIDVVVLAAQGVVPEQIGATGCGHKVVYVATPSGWVVNTQSDKAK